MLETFIYEASGILEIHINNNILKTSFNIYNMYSTRRNQFMKPPVSP
jgi:hypothetical protein